MGLDMYLIAEKSFLDKEYRPEEEQKICKKVREIIPEIYKSGNLNTIEISFEAGYWRKSNQIHTWFVENVQEGEDDCGKYYVSKDDLKKLLELCKEVLSKTKLIVGQICNGYQYKEGKKIPIIEEGKIIQDSTIAKDLLPTQSGFFFGNTDYNEYYIHDIKRTIEIIEKALKLPKEWSFYYRSSW